MAGRRPKPLAIHQLNGNPRHMSQADLRGDDNPQPKLGEPEMPKGMSRAARREWRSIVPLLMEVGVLANIDGKALAGYCESYALWELARKEYQTHGITFREMYENKDGEMVPGNIKPNPAVAIASTALKTMKSFLIEFGLTPASRRNLKITKKSDGDAMEEYMRSKPSSAPLVFKPVAIDPKDMVADDGDDEPVSHEIES